VSRRAAFLLAICLAGLLTAAPGTAAAQTPAPDPQTCTGYPEKRIFLESQGWWTRTNGMAGTDFGHVHSGTCFPWGQRISGRLRFDVRLTMHENPGVITSLQVQMFGSGAPEPIAKIPLNYTCAATCTWWVPVEIDTTLAYDGCQEFRFQAWVREPDGKQLLATTGFRAHVTNGREVKPYCGASGANWTEGRGWYTDSGYENARVEDTLPMEPVSGVWSPKLKATVGADGIAPTHHLIAVDPNFHMGSSGWVLQEGAGGWGAARLAIDTTRLADGAHRLVIRTDANAFDGSTLSGLLVVPFTVANGTVPAPTEPAPTEPAPTEPAPTEPAPTEPAPTEPAPTEPTPTPAPTEPAPTGKKPRKTKRVSDSSRKRTTAKKRKKAARKRRGRKRRAQASMLCSRLH
jgi:hypothetical protein